MYPFLKKIKAALLPALCIVVLTSCSSDDDPGPEPDPPVCTADTLSAGWSNVAVDPVALSDVFFKDNNNGVAAGDTGLYNSSDGGLSWSRINNEHTYTNLFVTASGTVFGARGELPLVSASLNSNLYTVGSLRAMDLYFTDNNNGFATVKGPSYMMLYHTTDAGNSWTKIDHHMKQVTSGYEYATLHFNDPAKGWVAYGKAVYRVNNGLITDSVQVPTSTSYPLASIYAVSASVVYAAGFGSEIFKSNNGGVSFVKLSSLVEGSNGYTDIHFLSEMVGYACNYNKIFKTTDGGQSWQTVVTICTGMVTEIHFTDATHGWACTDKGKVYRYIQ